jgi:hypothetical protein
MGVDGPAAHACGGDVLFRDGEGDPDADAVRAQSTRRAVRQLQPEGVLWAQVGISPVYQMLLGAAEVLGGLLLLLPRTAAAGALVCAFDLTQVFILNMTYDIRLKSVSSQLLLLSLFLLAPYARRLLAVLFTDRAIPATVSAPLFASRRANRVALIVQVCAGLVLLAAFGGQGWQQFTRPTPNL